MSQGVDNDPISRAMTCHFSRDWQGVKANLEPVLAIDPKAVFSGMLANAYRMLGKPEEAKAEYQRELEISPEAAVRLSYARLLMARGEKEEAQEQIAHIELTLGADVQKIADLGDAQFEIGLSEDGLRTYQRALTLATEKEALFARRAAHLYRLERWEAAEKDATAALTGHLPPALRLETLLNRAWSRWRQGLPECISDLDEALKIAPGRGETHFYRGIMLAGLGRLEEAEADYDAAVAAEPNRAEYVLTRGSFRLKRKGDAAGALADFLRTRELDPAMTAELDEMIAACQPKPGHA